MEGLKRSPIDVFAENLASHTPAPGGGSTAALEGALGASLLAMVCRLTIGKPDFQAREETLKKMAEETDTLRGDLLRLMDEDTNAFLKVSDAYAMPKTSEQEKQLRRDAIQRGLLFCIQTPMDVMKRATDTLHCAEQIAEGFNSATASDFGVAILSLRAAVMGAWLNVCVNLKSLKDVRMGEAINEAGMAILDHAMTLSESLYRKVTTQIP